MLKTPAKQKRARIRNERPEKEHLELLRQLLEELRGLRLILVAQPKPTGIDWDNLPEEDISLYKPSFVRRIKQAEKEIKAGKGRVVKSLADLCG